MPKCSCQAAFVGLEFAEPEVDNLEVDADGHVTGTIRIHRDCDQCGQELRGAEFEIDVDLSEKCTGHQGEGHELEVHEDTVEQIEEGGGRYAKSFFGARIEFHITCSCEKLDDVSGEYDDKVPASGMDELG